MADDLLPFERVWDGIDELQKLLKEGPEVGKSAGFLSDITLEICELYEIAKNLTVEDVDAEFTDEGEDDAES